MPRGLSASVTKLYLVRAAWGRSAVRPGADRRRASSVHSGKPDSSAGSTTEDDDDDAADDEVADWRIETFEMSLLGGAPPAKLLRSIEVVVLVSSAQTFLWQGNHSTVFQRWAGLRLARLFSTEGSFGVCRVMEGAESALFCSHFVLPHAPHPPHPPPPCLQLLAQRREERAERRRAREAVLKHDREADVGEAYISTAPEHVHIVGAAVPAKSTKAKRCGRTSA